MRHPVLLAVAAASLFASTALSATRPATASEKAGWDRAAAARYMDQRLGWWRAWPKAQRDHGTVCVSCHSVLPYALGRKALRQSLHEAAPPAIEQAMRADVVQRVWTWREVEPFYPDQTRGIPKSAESRGSEAVINALILASRDAESGHLANDTRQAFANLWPQQMQGGAVKGSFPWLNFHLEPWESPDAVFWGATLAARAVATAPEGYAQGKDIAPQLDALRAYLHSGASGQSLFTRALVLWSDSAIHGVLNEAERHAIVADMLAAQGIDGGWALPKLSAWQRVDNSALPVTSDGYATAMFGLILRDNGDPAAAAAVTRARQWIAQHQNRASGAVPALSINKDRKPDADPYLFMTDAATGYAALLMQD